MNHKKLLPPLWKITAGNFERCLLNQVKYLITGHPRLQPLCFTGILCYLSFMGLPANDILPAGSPQLISPGWLIMEALLLPVIFAVTKKNLLPQTSITLNHFKNDCDD